MRSDLYPKSWITFGTFNLSAGQNASYTNSGQQVAVVTRIIGVSNAAPGGALSVYVSGLLVYQFIVPTTATTAYAFNEEFWIPLAQGQDIQVACDGSGGADGFISGRARADQS